MLTITDSILYAAFGGLALVAVMLLVSAVMVVVGHRSGGLLLQVGMALAGPLLSFVLLLRIAFNAGMMGAFAALNESERQSLHLSMAMAGIPCCLGILAAVGVKHRPVAWMGRILVVGVAPAGALRWLIKEGNQSFGAWFLIFSVTAIVLWELAILAAGPRRVRPSLQPLGVL
ncbi:hypothetical protein [Luteolibacter luteus]|uniref:Uncharacterized protein n=1 Tax=Luteolibacter luteus TaxID=2728835 RepID=A0A858RN90_9BACT|nr:hypothetical protein [Luteolibacter luteus]QJE98061.1 hypothetical protein HHL09_20485 [Luteolibacter luteus]